MYKIYIADYVYFFFGNFQAGYIGCLSFSFLFVYLSRAYYVMLLACSTIGIFGGSLDGVFSVFIGDTFGMKLYPAVFSYSATLIHVAGLGWSVIIGKIFK